MANLAYRTQDEHGDAALAYARQDEQIGDAAAISRLMGLQQWSEMSDLALADRVAAGLPPGVVDRVASIMALGDPSAKFSLVSRSTYSRRRKQPQQHLAPDISGRIYGVARVLHEALSLWHGDGDSVRRFLNRPHPLLEGRTPLDVARDSVAGAELVGQIIGRARAGVAV